MKRLRENQKTPVSIKQAKKKLLVKILAIISIVLAVLLAAVAAIDVYLKNKITPPVMQSADDYLTKSFRTYYPMDFEADLSEDKEYMALNREVMYADSGSALYSLSDLDESLYHEGQEFFSRYFDIAISGNFEEYPSLFTQSYKENPTGFEKHTDREFPPQRIYNITVKELARTSGDGKDYYYEKKPCEFGFYEVEFMVLKNDGCFRRDLPENGSRALIFELVTFEDKSTCIKNLYTPNSVTSETAVNN